MDRVWTAVLCGLLGAVAFGLLGAVWGGGVRVLAKLRESVPDFTVGESFRKGLRSGAVFLAILGGVLGFVVGLIEPSAEESLGVLADHVWTSGLVMLVIVFMIGVPATLLVRAALMHRQGVSQTPVSEEPRVDRSDKTSA